MIRDLCPEVSPLFIPSKWQIENVVKGVTWEDGPDIDGWWLGECPICGAGCVYNFQAGCAKCLAEEPCHERWKRASGRPKQSMTFMTIVKAMPDA
jgi:hypothetical protein